MPRKIDEPPSSITGPLGEYLSRVARILNALPTQSLFSGTTPNSLVTGVAGDLAMNVGSASTSSRLWIKAGDPITPDQSNWNVVRIA